MNNYQITISYDGSFYSGWQNQPHAISVQEVLEKAFSQIFGQKNSKPISVIGASRTDAGVHALAQKAHVKLPSKPDLFRLRYSLNGILPAGVSILEIKKVRESFQASYDAKKKTYRYLIWNSPLRNPLLEKRAWHYWNPLNLSAMKKAAKFLVGKHDFSAFRAAQSDTKTSVRKIHQLKISRKSFSEFSSSNKKDLVVIEISGNGFLKYMVRNIVGTLVEMGRGRWKPEQMKEILKSKDRKKAGVTAPAHGLYLVKINY